jgi:hypothetical protein
VHPVHPVNPVAKAGNSSISSAEYPSGRFLIKQRIASMWPYVFLGQVFSILSD